MLVRSAKSRDSSAYAARLVAEQAAEPVRVAENVEPGVPGEAAFDASPTGTMTYRQSAPARLAQLTWLDRGGRPIGHVGEPGPNITVWISPDQRFALAEQWGARGTPSSGTASRIDLETGAATRLFANAAAPIWSPDGSRIAFTQFLADLMRYAALNQRMQQLARYGDFIPNGGPESRVLPDAASQARYSDEQLYALAMYLYSLKPPPNPNPFDAVAA